MKVEDMNLDVNVDELAHYGVLGMRWGVRRTDAQLAAAANRKQQAQANKEVRAQQKQQKHEVKIARQKDKLEVRSQKAKVKAEEAKARQLSADAKNKEYQANKVKEESRAKIKADKVKAKEEKRRFDVQQEQAMVKAKMEAGKLGNKQTPTNFSSKDFKRMSDDDLRTVVNRMNLEKQYQTLNPTPPSTMKKVLGVVGTTAVTTKGIVDMMGGTQAVYSMVTGKKTSSKHKPAKDMTVEEMESIIRRSNVVSQYNKIRRDSTPADPMAANLEAAINLAAMLSKKK